MCFIQPLNVAHIINIIYIYMYDMSIVWELYRITCVALYGVVAWHSVAWNTISCQLDLSL